MRLYLVALAILGTVGLTACGGDATTPTATPTRPIATTSAAASSRTPTVTPTQATPIAARGTATPAPTASPASTGESGIEGIVTIGPTCPVQRIDSPCPDRPYPADIVVLDGAGRRVASISSGADGRFRIALPPGSYTLSPQHRSTPPSAREQIVTVVAGSFAAVQIVYDSGIR